MHQYVVLVMMGGETCMHHALPSAPLRARARAWQSVWQAAAGASRDGEVRGLREVELGNTFTLD